MRDIQPALPCELNEQQQIALTRKFAERLAERYDTVVSHGSFFFHLKKKTAAPDPPGRRFNSRLTSGPRPDLCRWARAEYTPSRPPGTDRRSRAVPPETAAQIRSARARPPRPDGRLQ